MNREKTLKERLEISYISRTEDLTKLFNHNSCEYGYTCEVNEDLEECPIVQELGLFNEYGLSFDYVEEYTFSYQKEPYFRYQISWGGPSEEYRIYTDDYFNIERVEFWFLDWFEGIHKVLDEDNIIYDIIEDFKDIGLLEHVKEKALETEEEYIKRLRREEIELKRKAQKWNLSFKIANKRAELRGEN